MDSAALLRRFVEENSQEAFTELVATHLDLVYSAALRQVDGDSHGALEVAQLVFTDLARKAPSLLRHTSLTGWLYTSTHFAAAKLRRNERRRQTRETEAHHMHELLGSPEPAAQWEQVRPVLDQVMHELGARDREAILLRFFENRSFADVGRHLGLGENAARMRVERALDKLHALLAKRRITSTASALGVAFAHHAVAVAPAGVASTVAGAALSAAATGGALGIAGLFTFMKTTHIVATALGVAALLGIASAVYQNRCAERAGIAQRAAAEDYRALLQERAELHRRLGESDLQLAELRKQLEEFRSAPRAATNQPVAPATRAPNQLTPELEFILTHPAAREAHVEKSTLITRAQLERFFQSAKLPPEQQERVIALYAEMKNRDLDLIDALRQQGFTAGALPKNTANAMQTKTNEEVKARNAWFQESLRSLLGEDGFAQHQAYWTTMNARLVADQVASGVYHTNTPLTAEAADKLVQIVAANGFTKNAVPVAIQGVDVSLAAFSKTADRDGWRQGGVVPAPITYRALAQAETLLAPEQVAMLRHLQARQSAALRITREMTPAKP